MKILNVGYDNYVAIEKVIAVVNPDSAPVKRLINQSQKSGFLVDATQGHKTRSVIVTESRHVVLSALNSNSISERIKKKE